MKDITIIIPIHYFDNNIQTMLSNALKSVKKNQETYTYGKLIPLIVAPVTVINDITPIIEKVEDHKVCVNTSTKTDFCSQVNLAVQNVETEHFSILEVDDEYKPNWFAMANEYFYGNESISLFLPINIITDTAHQHFQYANEIVWASSFSNELGYLDFDCLQDYSSFNLTGGIFNTVDFNAVGRLKPSIKAAFSYEFLLRLTKKELKVFVVPKEGYIHTMGREGSLTDEYEKTLNIEDINKWFELAKSECAFTEDREIGIEKIKAETLK